MKKQCEQIQPENDKRCQRNGRFVMSLRPYGQLQKRLVTLCGTHDKIAGRLNLTNQGWSMEEARIWERKPDLLPEEVA